MKAGTSPPSKPTSHKAKRLRVGPWLVVAGTLAGAVAGSGCIHRVAVYVVVENRTDELQSGEIWLLTSTNETIFHHRFDGVSPISETGLSYTADGGKVTSSSGVHWIRARVNGMALDESRDLGDTTGSIVLVIESDHLALYQTE